jgi:c-di-GMP-binding flagellar brake protein YcgR
VKLTPQHLAEVVNALQSSPANGKGSEKRRAARMEVQGNVVIAPVAKDGTLGKSFTAITRDISFVGIGLLQSKLLEQGQRIVVRLPRGVKPALFMLCIVMHVRPLADGLYVMGVEFTTVASIKEEQLLGKAGDTELQRVRQLILT